MTEAERERVAIVAYLRDKASDADRRGLAAPSRTKLRACLLFEALALSQEAQAIERCAHFPTPAQSTEGER